MHTLHNIKLSHLLSTFSFINSAFLYKVVLDSTRFKKTNKNTRFNRDETLINFSHRKTLIKYLPPYHFDTLMDKVKSCINYLIEKGDEFALRLIDGFRCPETHHRITSHQRHGAGRSELVIDRAP